MKIKEFRQIKRRDVFLIDKNVSFRKTKFYHLGFNQLKYDYVKFAEIGFTAGLTSEEELVEYFKYYDAMLKEKNKEIKRQNEEIKRENKKRGWNDQLKLLDELTEHDIKINLDLPSGVFYYDTRIKPQGRRFGSTKVRTLVFANSVHETRDSNNRPTEQIYEVFNPLVGYKIYNGVASKEQTSLQWTGKALLENQQNAIIKTVYATLEKVKNKMGFGGYNSYNSKQQFNGQNKSIGIKQK